ncbi:hypothetical protein SteCoe_37664 [Stentor coeruleus]|uniref:F-box domain-containing protein n=1 Tax=Stentor coeruleus TaxID=5963 RepID=A0A1R2AMJ9_9CILI|nr:hypothetical protein SteCoe_37664 [Stentor coeruleus]
MDKIPSVLYADIFVFLNVREIFRSLILVSKSFKNEIESSHFLNLVLMWTLRAEGLKRFTEENALNLLKELTNKKKQEFLEFLPCSTDGGADEDQESFWFGHAFEYNDKAWCTLEGSFNANASGVLASTQDLIGYHWANKEAVSIVRSWLKKKGKPLYKKNEHIAVAIFNHVVTSFPLDAISIDEPDPEAFKQTVRKIFINLRPFKSGIEESRRFPNKNDVLDMPFDRNSADNSSFYAIINQLSISRKGGFTCPVKTLMVFISHVYIDILDPSLKVYNDMKEYENLIHVHDYFPSSAQPREKIIEPGVEYCEFGWTNEILKPVLWVNFLATERISEKNFKLKQLVSAKYVYVKLICPEDRREERNWNHEVMNIDCNYVVPKGRLIFLG